MIIGEKSHFAVELFNNGQVLIWIGGIPVGTKEDSSDVGIILNQLERVSFSFNFQEANIALSNLSAETAWKLVFSDSSENGAYLLSFGDAFDDFILAYVSDGESIMFLWKLSESTVFEYEGYSSEIHNYVVASSNVRAVYEQLRCNCSDLSR
ncbi:MAG: hypothetical protein HWE11_07225 [Gammaproteobacteria bacterium]|nr:hypothetical protein [Gammaproteobacteria bacterium]